LPVSFKADIRKLQFLTKDDRIAIYAAATSFGDMALLVETVSHPAGSALLDALLRRNALMATQELAAPLVYEQEVVRVREDCAFCLTLTEPVRLCRPHELPLNESAFEGLVRCVYRAARAGLSYEGECLRLERAMQAEHNGGLFMDFTRVVVEEKAGAALE
jgi:hypothetical protein